MTVRPVPDVAGVFPCHLYQRSRLRASFGEVRVPHRGNVVEKVIEGLTKSSVCSTGWKRSVMRCSPFTPATGTTGFCQSRADVPLGEEHQPVTEAQILTPRRYEDVRMTCGQFLIGARRTCSKGAARTYCQRQTQPYPRGERHRGDVKLNRALWVMAEKLQQALADATTA